MFLGFCTWKPNFWPFSGKISHFGCKNTVFRCKNPMFQVQILHVLGAKMTCFECNFWTVCLGANKLTLFELEPFETAVTSIFNKSESRICTQTRPKLHSKHVIFAPKTCRNCTWNLGFLHLKTLFLHPKTVKFSPFPGEIFTIWGAKIKILGAKTRNQVQKQWNFHYFCTIFAPLLCKKKVSFCTQNRVCLHSNPLVFAPKTRKKKPKKKKQKKPKKIRKKKRKKRRFSTCKWARDCGLFCSCA